MEDYERREHARQRRHKYYMANRERMLAASKEWKKNHPKRMSEIHSRAAREYYRRHRDAVLEKLGGKCARCGIDDRRVLCIDHVHGGGTKEFRELGAAKLMKKVLDDENGEYQILCHNCNWIKRYENREAFGWGKHQRPKAA